MIELNHQKKASTLALLSLLTFPFLTCAQTYEGKIVNGGGVDDLQIGVKVSSSQTISAYCNS
jgi:hypothetical protein